MQTSPLSTCAVLNHCIGENFDKFVLYKRLKQVKLTYSRLLYDNMTHTFVQHGLCLVLFRNKF